MRALHSRHGRERLRCAAVIVAAGTGQRMQGVDKIMTELAGEPVIVHTVRAFENSPCIDEIVVVARRDQVETMENLLREQGFSKVKAVVPGGDTRVGSVRNGLSAVSRTVELAAIQDGARPLVTEAIIARTVERAGQCHAAAPAVPVKDTIKVAREGVVQQTPDRARLFGVQTPQVFEASLIKGALTKAWEEGAALTDDCSAVERIGFPVCLTQGSEENIKITTPRDLTWGEAILAERMGR